MAKQNIQLGDVRDSLRNATAPVVELQKIDVPYGSYANIDAIQNRAQVTDFVNDLRPRLGVERITFQNGIEEVSGEIGPAGEKVWKLKDDIHGRVRFVGANWAHYVNEHGFNIATNTDGYMEICFYGTGLNIMELSQTGQDTRATIDNGSEGANFIPTSWNAGLLQSRNYAPNCVVNVAAGLSLGFHTIKIRHVSGWTPLNGIEILNEEASGNITTNLGTSFDGHTQKRLTAQHQAVYNTGFTNITRDGTSQGSISTKGGRVLVYQDENGLIKKDIVEVDSSQGNLGSADHGNEEIVRRINFREFGAGRADDFSTVAASSSDRAFTLDDGTTTLVGDDIGTGGTGVGFYAGGSFLVLTFVGTGLDIVTNGTPTGDVSVDVDGSNIGLQTFTVSDVVTPIVSGLPYGTHTVKITNDGLGGTWGLNDFVIYGPKTPDLPEGATPLGTYNLMADFVASGGVGYWYISQGVMRKGASREIVYSGTWAGGVNVGATGIGVQSRHVGDTLEYTFWGTGVEMLGWCSFSAADMLVYVDGSLYTGSATIWGSGAAWTAGSSTWTASASGGGGIRISGLSLGKHTIKFETSTGVDSQYFNATWIDIITPIHDVIGDKLLDPSMWVGSCGIQSQRSFVVPEGEEVILGKKTFRDGISIPGVGDIYGTQTAVGNHYSYSSKSTFGWRC